MKKPEYWVMMSWTRTGPIVEYIGSKHKTLHAACRAAKRRQRDKQGPRPRIVRVTEEIPYGEEMEAL